MRAIRHALRRTRLFGVWRRLGVLPDYWYWRLRGRPVRSPHYLKQKTVLQYARAFHLDVLVEAGTYFGDMIAGTRTEFHEIYSVELEDWLYERARRRFARFPHIHLLHGSSGELIPRIVSELQSPALFWLDAGYYGFADTKGNPDRIQIELNAILGAPHENVILIDDARGFTGREGAASIEDLRALVRRLRPECVLYVHSDIVRIHRAPGLSPIV